MYSGVSLDVCLAFIGPPAPMYEEYDEFDEGVFYGYIVDMALCFTVDTLALPYTVMRQVKDGNLRLKRKPERFEDIEEPEEDEGQQLGDGAGGDGVGIPASAILARENQQTYRASISSWESL